MSRDASGSDLLLTTFRVGVSWTQCGHGTPTYAGYLPGFLSTVTKNYLLQGNIKQDETQFTTSSHFHDYFFYDCITSLPPIHNLIYHPIHCSSCAALGATSTMTRWRDSPITAPASSKAAKPKRELEVRSPVSPIMNRPYKLLTVFRPAPRKFVQRRDFGDFELGARDGVRENLVVGSPDNGPPPTIKRQR